MGSYSETLNRILGIRQRSRDMPHQATYYFISAYEEGKHIVWGPFASEEEAQNKAFSSLHGDFETVALPTRDLSEASRHIRAQKLEQTQSVPETFKRFTHTGAGGF